MHAVTTATVPVPLLWDMGSSLQLEDLAFEAGDVPLAPLQRVEGAAESGRPASQRGPLLLQPGPEPLRPALLLGGGRRGSGRGPDDAAARGGHVRRPPRPGI